MAKLGQLKSVKPSVKSESSMKAEGKETKQESGSESGSKVIKSEAEAKTKTKPDPMDSLLDDIEVDLGLAQVDVKSNRFMTSTGLLSLDLMLSGGMVTGGWYTVFGGEQSSKCVRSDSLVLTSQGLLRIEEIFADATCFTQDHLETLSFKLDKFYDIPSDLQVIAHDGTQVEADKVYMGRGYTHKIKTKIGDELIGLPEHKVQALVDGVLKWQRLDELEEGVMLPKLVGQNIYADFEPSITFKPDAKYLSYLKNKNITTAITIPQEMSEELAELFGWIVAEGDRQGKFYNSDPDVLDRYNDLSLSLFGVEAKKTAKSNCLSLHNLALCFVTEHVGKVKSAERFTPELIRRSPKHIQVAYLKALFEGDGTVTSQIQYTSISKRLILETKAMLENMGMLCFIDTHKTWATNGSSKQKAKTGYRLNIHIDFSETFKEEIGFSSKKKRKALNALIEKYQNSSGYNSKSGITQTIPGREMAVRLIEIVNQVSPSLGIKVNQGQSSVFRKFKTKDLRLKGVGLTRFKLSQVLGAIKEHGIKDDLPSEARVLIKRLKKISKYYWSPVVESKPTGKTEIVYDLSVPGPHSYQVNGLIGHNSSLVMTQMARAVNMPVKYIVYADYEGCVVADTKFLVNGVEVPLANLIPSELLNNPPEAPCFMDFQLEVDTVGKETVPATLYYGGLKPLTKILTESQRELIGSNHPVLVLNDEGGADWKLIEDLQVGDKVLTS